MVAELSAALSALGWAGNAVLVRLGSRTASVVSAAYLSYCVTVVCLWSYLLLFVPLDLLDSPATVLFLVAGCFQPLLTRILYYMGIARLGVSRAGPLRSSAPLFAVLVAVLFLGERPALVVYGGAILVVAGTWFISWRQGEETNWKVTDLFFPLGAAFIAAAAQNLRRAGLLILPNPYVGAAISTGTSLVIFSIYLAMTGRLSSIRPDRASFPYFAVAAVLSAAAQLLNFVALRHGDVSVVVPVLGSSPLFTVLFTSLFLRGTERVTGKIVVGAVLIVTGVLFVAHR